MRSLRSLLELPWLEYPEEDLCYLRGRVAELEGRSMSDAAQAQVGKAVRASRFCGAHNRLLRAAPGSLDDDLLRLARACHRIPEFVGSVPVARRPENPRLPKDLLVPMELFLQRYTDKGVLYHGTGNLESGLAIMRGGFFLSKEDQGMALFGPGVYMTPSHQTACAYGDGGGIVFKLHVRADEALRVVDWESAKSGPCASFVRAVEDEAERAHVHVFEWLAREYGVDIIVNTHVLVWNAEALACPKDPRELLEAYATVLQNPNAPLIDRARVFGMFRSLSPYAQALGSQLPSPLEVARPLVDELQAAISGRDNYATVVPLAVVAGGLFEELPPGLQKDSPIDPRTMHAAVAGILADPKAPPAVRLDAFDALFGKGRYILSRPAAWPAPRWSNDSLSSLASLVAQIAAGHDGPLTEILAAFEEGCRELGRNPEELVGLELRRDALKHVLSHTRWSDDRAFFRTFGAYELLGPDAAEANELYCTNTASMVADPDSLAVFGDLREFTRRFAELDTQARSRVTEVLQEGETRLLAAMDADGEPPRETLLTCGSKLSELNKLGEVAGRQPFDPFDERLEKLGQEVLSRPNDSNVHVLFGVVIGQIATRRTLTATERAQAEAIAAHVRRQVKDEKALKADLMWSTALNLCESGLVQAGSTTALSTLGPRSRP